MVTYFQNLCMKGGKDNGYNRDCQGDSYRPIENVG